MADEPGVVVGDTLSGSLQTIRVDGDAARGLVHLYVADRKWTAMDITVAMAYDLLNDLKAKLKEKWEGDRYFAVDFLHQGLLVYDADT